MNLSDRLVLLLIVAGISIIILGVALTIPEIQQTSTAGGALIFIGPIPIFLGWGASAEITLLLIVLMLILTVMGLILFRSSRRSSS
ncbi:MAG: DUF131 domain-containing protein [Candidatus Methanomethylicia archaeon]|jgi:uncharacterized membrane protein|nr:DUF131 domain-containing protein [Candidatus Methanomethylicia archaeon]